jgi:AAA domain
MTAIPKFEAIELGPIDARFAMLNNGYEPIPVWEKKRPVHSNWQNMSITHDEILGWRGTGPHTGLRTKHMPVFDIDILDGEAAIVVENVVRNFLGDRGEVLVRIGLAPKRAVPLRTDVPFKKIIVRLVAPNGNPHKIEVLGSGQQVVVAGIHPDTNRPYFWREGRSPINTPRQKLPLVTEADVRALLDECIKALVEIGWRVGAPVTGDDTDDEVVIPFESLEERLKKTEYKGSHSINQAILDIPLIRLSEGVVIEDIIKECMEVVRLICAVSGTMAPGGRGKSSLDLVEAVSMAIGRPLLSEEPLRRLKVWYHNGEENWDELCRRLDAVCQYYGIAHAELEGWFCITNPQRFPLRVAEIGSGDRFAPDRSLLSHMYEEIRTNEFEVISLDPLITLHSVPENNPVMMRGVMDIFRDLAASINCSCEIVGHTRKPPIGFDAQLTAYDTRGSGAIVDALRSVRMLDLMTTEEAEAADVEEYQRERHVKITPAKRNYSATAAAPEWIRIENLIIPNGDDVGVVSPWAWPSRDPAAHEASVQRAEGVFLVVAPRLIKQGQRLSDKKGANYAPGLIAEEAEAKEARVRDSHLSEAMSRLINVGKVVIFDGYKAGRPVHELRVVYDGF